MEKLCASVAHSLECATDWLLSKVKWCKQEFLETAWLIVSTSACFEEDLWCTRYMFLGGGQTNECVSFERKKHLQVLHIALSWLCGSCPMVGLGAHWVVPGVPDAGDHDGCGAGEHTKQQGPV